MDRSNSTRMKEIKIRLSQDELEFLNQNVAKTGLPRERYLRLLIAQKTPTALPPADYNVLIRKLYQIEEHLKSILRDGGGSENVSYLHITLTHLNDILQLIETMHYNIASQQSI